MNYYKILEVDRDASAEVIEKAYKTLVKKYHPDLQESNMKEEAEEKIKLINEAYEILSNPDSRAKYDMTLKQKEISEEDFSKFSDENKREQEHQKQYEEQLEYEKQLQRAREKAYHDAYIQDLKNRGYKIKYKKTPKDYFKNFIALVITIAILLILWQVPFIHNFFIKMYEENEILQYIVNFFK